ncbi:MAG: ABC transporter ATP-binding protein [Ardenticatenaceae bacterium]|nr:ABC transporter ATP-binding protein [Ardenticatenaceae bacterium]MCB8946650.1 ABC transporter ATP-binding protein [Ardenticatenaceae bacterium]
MGFHGGGWWAYISHDEKQERPAITRELLLRVWEFARPYRLKIILLLLTILIITGLSLVSPLLVRSLIDNAIPNENYRLLTLLAAGMVAIPIVNGGIGVFQRSLNSQIGEGVIYDLRRALYEHMQSMSLRFFTQSRTGELMSRLNNDVVGAQRAISDTIVTIISNIVSLVGTMAILLTLEWRLTLLGLAILPLFVLPARRVGRVLRDLRRKSLEISAEMNATMNETLNVSGALLVKLFGRQEREMKRFADDAADVRDIGVRSAVIGRWFFMMLSIIGAVGTAVVYWVGGYLVLQDAFTIGTIVAFGSYLAQLYGPLMALTNAPVEFAQSMVSFERVFEALDIPVEIAEKPDAVHLEKVDGRIQFHDISFTYIDAEKGGLREITRFNRHGSASLLKRGKAKENGETAENGAAAESEQRWALQNVSFTIEPGELVALVGPSGAGKTTITYLIPRLYDPSDGRITIDNHDLRDVTLNSLAENIGMVTQETYLFFDTIRANLLYARPDATDEQMIAAAKAANIHDFIAQLPDGYDTVVGERGYRLSGGERQRIAIARVVLKDPSILVLDEATSHLDSLSEALIQEALGKVMQGRSSLVIAHRLSTILAADKILVMEKGELVEQGTHETLLARGGLYANLYETQFKPTDTLM